MKKREIKTVNLVLDHRDANGYLKDCEFCGQTIYMGRHYKGGYAPYESWAAGNVNRGEWCFHRCLHS